MEFVIKFYGHPLIKATHKTTLEITKDNYLTERGDCIIGIRATHSVKDLPDDIKNHLKNYGKIKIIIKVDDLIDEIIAYGHKNLLLNDDRSIVIRKSDYIDSRTLAIKANKSARDINREIIEKLKKESMGEFIIKIL